MINFHYKDFEMFTPLILVSIYSLEIRNILEHRQDRWNKTAEERTNKLKTNEQVESEEGEVRLQVPVCKINLPLSVLIDRSWQLSKAPQDK